MTTTSHICDRCGSIILEHRTLLTVESGPIRVAGRLEIDLCADCSRALVDTFLVSVEPAAAEPVEVHL